MKQLIILNLENTLIYGTYKIGLSAKRLLRYSNSILFYERPYAREFIQKCNDLRGCDYCCHSHNKSF